MACIRERRGKYVLDYRSSGRRRWRTFPLTPAGLESAQAVKRRLEALAGGGGWDPDTTLGAYGKEWLAMVRTRVGDLTWSKYEIVYRVHLVDLHRRRLADLQRKQWKGFFAGLAAEKKLAPATLMKVLSVVHNLLEEAVDDGAFEANPTAALGHHLGLAAPRQQEVRAMEGPQLEAFLAAARATEAQEDYLPLVVLAYGGLRIGELVGLMLDDVQGQLSIERQILPSGTVKLPKGDKTRQVDLADALRQTLATGLAWRKEYDLRTGRRSPWLLYPDMDPAAARPGAETRIRRAVARVLKAAQLPGHFTPHCLRHTYASLLLQRGESLLYVSRQLGHRSIKLTADLYGQWLPITSDKGGPNLLAGGDLDTRASLRIRDHEEAQGPQDQSEQRNGDHRR